MLYNYSRKRYLKWKRADPTNYNPRIIASLLDNDLPVNNQSIQFSLFHCLDTRAGDIKLLGFCSEDSCTNGGTDKNESCTANGETSLEIRSSASSMSSRSTQNQGYVDMAVGIGAGVTAFTVALAAALVMHVRRRQAHQVIEMADLSRSGSIAGKGMSDMSAEEAMADLIGTDLTQGPPTRSATLHNPTPAPRQP